MGNTIDTMKKFLTLRAAILLPAIANLGFVASFATTVLPPSATTVSSPSSTTALSMAREDDDLLRYSRAARSAGSGDTVVELQRPLGLILNQDNNGNVYVETVAPRGNAARSGKVKEGDIVTMCSATFGNEMWSTRGVGLTRVLAAIRVRAGSTVSLVFESPTQYQKKAALSTKQMKAQEEARLAAQRKKDQLLDQLERDEVKLKKGKFFGLF